MRKKEMINEIKNVVMNNGGKVDFLWVTFTVNNGELIRTDSGHAKKVKYETVTQIEIYLNWIRDFVAQNKPKATKKDIIMGLHKNGKVNCDLATAEALATEGLIYIKSYEDGVLRGEVEYDAICEALISEDDIELFDEVREGHFQVSDWSDKGYLNTLDYVTDWSDKGYLDTLEYDGHGRWVCRVDWFGILNAFCKRYDNKLNEVA